jgi:hypothetical protein
MDNELEAAIDQVGRDHVFLRAQAHGWGAGSTPPAWVWWGIVQELKDGVPPPAPRGGIFDFLGI